jgi:hypothetical protein
VTGPTPSGLSQDGQPKPGEIEYRVAVTRRLPDGGAHVLQWVVAEGVAQLVQDTLGEPHGEHLYSPGQVADLQPIADEAIGWPL